MEPGVELDDPCGPFQLGLIFKSASLEAGVDNFLAQFLYLFGSEVKHPCTLKEVEPRNYLKELQVHDN